MCFGCDGERALRDSLDQKGARRRSLLRGAAHVRGQGHGSRSRSVPHDRISIQMYTLRDATDADTLPAILHRLAQYGYEKVERRLLRPHRP